MTHDETQAGTPVLEMSPDEYRNFLDEEARRRLGTSAAEFRRRHIAGDWTTAIPTWGCWRRCSRSARTTIVPPPSVALTLQIT
jgi:hypothetical protein